MDIRILHGNPGLYPGGVQAHGGCSIVETFEFCLSPSWILCRIAVNTLCHCQCRLWIYVAHSRKNTPNALNTLVLRK